jgi:asparagine synthase (glutamine-hydrolysing)
MCGLTGYLRSDECRENVELESAQLMAREIAHRGPDDSGVWLDADAGIALAHRRLSILDLSPAGHQPMFSPSGRYVIAFNGEIYNHIHLRETLQKNACCIAWGGHSDTETLLAGFDACGISATVEMSIGMFAFAVWDKLTRTLTLVCDRLGEKPLYYGWQGGFFLFGSELKALKAHPAFRAEINRDALALYLRHNAIPAPHSIYKGIYKLLPGTFLQLSAGQKDARPVAYWSVRSVAEAGQRNPYQGSYAEAVAELKRLLDQAVGGQMVADVPLGAFLSGGVDSSTVVALMQAQSARPVRTFTIGFHEDGYNEAEHARVVAAHLGTDHTELYVTAEQAMAVVPRLPALYDEPFADSSQIPTFLVAELARQHVTVSLSGDGGDELFGGYNRYFWAKNIWRRIGWMPLSLRAALAGALTSLPPSAWNQAFKGLSYFLPAGWRYANPGDKVHKVAEILAVRSPEEIYLALVSHWKKPADVVLGAREPLTVLTEPAQWAVLPDFESRMMYLDQMTYLPDDILTKVDRAAMGVSLETRVPLLDHRVVEFAWSLPLSMKIRHGQGKWLLRQVLYQHVPKAMIERPKMGFGVPIDVWLRGPLKNWAESLLDESRLVREGYFNPAPIREKWVEHLAGRRNWSYYLWDVLMFQAWLEAC